MTDVLKVKRRKSRPVQIGKFVIGGTNPIRIQSMTRSRTDDIEATVREIHSLTLSGCEIVRVSVLTPEAAKALGAIKTRIAIPLVADIHFNHLLALEAIRQGVDKVRLNPGTMEGKENVRRVVKAARERGIPIRIGVNSGSLPHDLIKLFDRGKKVKALYTAALREIEVLDDCGLKDIIVSVKSPDPLLVYAVNKKLARAGTWPIHLGVTESGSGIEGVAISTAGLGPLLLSGIGDTIRISLTGEANDEISAGWELLKSYGLRTGPRAVSCPSCGRNQLGNFKWLVEEVKKFSQTLPREMPYTISVMGCVVNGPGEARHADIGLVGIARDKVRIFRKGKIFNETLVSEQEAYDVVVTMAQKDVFQWQAHQAR